MTFTAGRAHVKDCVSARLNFEHQKHTTGLKSWKSEQKLKDAFAGESQANRR